MVDRSGKRQVWSDGWSDWWNLAWSPDGEEIWFSATLGGAAATLSAVDRQGSVRPLLAAPGAIEIHDVAPGPNDLPIQWTRDGRRLFLLDPSSIPGRIFSVDVVTGERTIWHEIVPVDPAGVAGVDHAVVTPDATAYAYSYSQFRSDLYLLKGLR